LRKASSSEHMQPSGIRAKVKFG